MEILHGDDEQICIVRAKPPGIKNLCLSKNRDTAILHLNDNSKCFETGVFDISKQKTISMSWTTGLQLKEAITAMLPHAAQMLENRVSYNIFFRLIKLDFFI